MGEITQTVATLGSAWGVLLTACTVANVVAAVLLARSSLPRRLQVALDASSAEVARLSAQVAEFSRQNEAHESTMRSLIEEHQDSFERAERKRASAAATASRASGRPQNGPLTREQIVNELRRREQVQ